MRLRLFAVLGVCLAACALSACASVKLPTGATTQQRFDAACMDLDQTYLAYTAVILAKPSLLDDRTKSIVRATYRQLDAVCLTPPANLVEWTVRITTAIDKIRNARNGKRLTA